MKIKVITVPKGVVTPNYINVQWRNLIVDVKSFDTIRYYVSATDVYNRLSAKKQPRAALFWKKIAGANDLIGLPKKNCKIISTALLC